MRRVPDEATRMNVRGLKATRGDGKGERTEGAPELGEDDA